MTTTEFWGSVIAGVIATVVYAILTWLIRFLNDSARYRYLNSKGEEFDWTCYKMDNSDGRRISEKNGAIVRITPKSGKVLNIRLMHPGTGKEGIRQWRGRLTMMADDIGVISLSYDDTFEFDVRQVFIGTSEDSEGSFDYIFYKGDGKDYGSELMRRSTNLRAAPKQQ